MTVLARAVTQEYRKDLTATPEFIGRTRRLVTVLLHRWGWGELTESATLCITEMLSNVHKHADSDVCVLLLQTSPVGVRVVVSDDSPKLPVVHEPDSFAENGRGMFLLSTTADAWGADPTEDGKDVWVEFLPNSVEAA
ncbi:ATP-binding protein [Streptomyces scopuliridis]|uniref:ATP-binding protein n=1 Tax=Streptomyces scopuliridis TaxID=452529 RepID=UPI0036792FBF